MIFLYFCSLLNYHTQKTVFVITLGLYHYVIITKKEAGNI